LIHKFAFENEKADHAVELIRRFSRSVELHGVVRGVCRDPDDDVILDCAVAGNADMIVTGDKDLLALDPFTPPMDSDRRIRIVRAREFLTMLRQERGEIV